MVQANAVFNGAIYAVISGKRLVEKMNNVKSHTALLILSRSFAAIVGGYVLSNLVAIFISYLLPMSVVDSVLMSLQLSFLLYSFVIIWVFSVKTATKAWLGLVIACAISFIGLYLTMPASVI